MTNAGTKAERAWVTGRALPVSTWWGKVQTQGPEAGALEPVRELRT